MKFQLNVNLTEQDYTDWNIFALTKSAYGKRQKKKMRILITGLVAVYYLLGVVTGFLTAGSFFDISCMAIAWVVCQLILTPLSIQMTKMHIKSVKKSGKLPFSPVSEMEFYEEHFVEITPESKNEQKYCGITRISIVVGKVIYMHLDDVRGFILPVSCFASKEQYDQFLAFIKTKCANVDTYEK